MFSDVYLKFNLHLHGTEVTFGALTPEVVQDYVASGEPMYAQRGHARQREASEWV